MGNLIDGDDHLPAEEVGKWAKEKHDYLCRYIDISRGVRQGYLPTQDKRQFKGGATYIDLLAISGFPKEEAAWMRLICKVFALASVSTNCTEYAQRWGGHHGFRVIPVGPQPLALLARPLGALGLSGPRRRPAGAVDYGDDRATPPEKPTAYTLEMSLGNPD